MSQTVKSFKIKVPGLFAGHEGFKTSRVGSGRVGSRGVGKLMGRVRLRPARNGSLAGRASMTRKLFSADPWFEPTHPARGPDIRTLPAFLPKGFFRTNTQ